MIVIDVETSGTNPTKHSILSIGAIDSLHPEEQFYEECRMWDGAHIDERALEVNGFSREEITLQSKQSEGELIAQFLRWIELREEITPAGQTPLFDLGFIQNAAGRAGENYNLPHRSIDLHSITFAHMIRRGIIPPVFNKRTDLNSDKIMDYVGIPPEPRPHKAINGALWELEAFSRILFDKSILPEFNKYPIPWVKE